MQLGFHGVMGLGIAVPLVRALPTPNASALATGTVLGSLLPDLDVYPAAVASLCCGKAASEAIHRSATHSLLLLGVLVAASFVPLAWRGWPWLLRGLAVGVAAHLLADYFMWFAPLDLFWPFSHVPGLASVLGPLHEGAEPPRVPAFGNPDFVRNMREAVEFAGFACFFLALARVARQKPSAAGSEPRLVFWQRAAWALFVVAVLVGVRAPYRPVVQTFVFAAWLLVFTPLCWIYTIRLRRAIVAWARATRKSEAART